MDPVSLDRLFQQTRNLAESGDEPLLRFYYWVNFLDLYLESGIRAPVYLLECLPEITTAIQNPNLDLFDPVLLERTRGLAANPALSGREDAAALRLAVASYRFPQTGHGSETTAAAREVVIPVILVAQGRALWNRTPSLGIPVLLRVRASRGFVAAGQISWRNRLVPGNEIQSVAHDALHAAVSLTGNIRPRLAYEIEVGPATREIAGGSLGLALGVCFSAFEAAEGRKPQLLPTAGTALTGGLDRNGGVTPVAPATVGRKVRAAAAAGFARLIIPKENAADADAECIELRKRLPGLLLPELIPITHLRETTQCTGALAPPLQSLRKKVRRARRVRTGILALVAVLASVWGLYLHPRQWTPENVTAKVASKDQMSVLVRLEGFPQRIKHFTSASPIVTARVAHLEPLAHCVLFIGTGRSGPAAAHLSCIDLSRGKTLWTRDFSTPGPLPAGVLAGNRMHVEDTLVTDLDADGRMDVVVIVQASPQSPCFIFWLDAEGHKKAVYAHRGYLFGLGATDYDGDGRPEIFSRGTSNSDSTPYGQRGTLVVLNATHFSGWPGDGPFTGSTTAPFDSCLARVIFPPIDDYCRLSEEPGFDAINYFVQAGPPTPIIGLDVGTLAYPGLAVTLDRNYRPVRIIVADNLKPVVHHALETGQIKTDFTTDERLQEYMRQILVIRPGHTGD